MNNQKPLLKLSHTAQAYWRVIVDKKTTEWSEADNLVACAMSRDLELLEDLARMKGDGLEDICRRVYEGSLLLKLSRATVTALAKMTKRTPQQEIIEIIQEGI